MNRILFLLVFATLAFQACDNDNDPACINGSGTTQTYELTLSDFNRIVTVGPVNVRYTQDTFQRVVITAEPEIYELMDIKVTNEVLELDFEDDSPCFNTNVGITAEITVPDLKGIDVSGSSAIITTDSVFLDEFTLDVSGSANLNGMGVIETLTINTSGLISAQLFDIEVAEATIDVSGTCNVDIFCTDVLNINISGSAVIRYMGNPTINQNVSGTLNLIDAN